MVEMATCDVNILKDALGIQQTGPRTVIIPADPIIWDAKTSYEYLTLVASTDFGQGYVAKKDVPSGTPLTNTEYWIPVASFNAQLANLQQSMAQQETALENETTNRVNADNALQAQINSVKMQYIFTVDTTNDISNVSATSGIIQTRGFATVGDGGDAKYIISNDGEANSQTSFATANSEYIATIVTDNEPFNVAKAGIFPDGADVSNKFSNLIQQVETGAFKFNIGTYKFNNAIYLPPSTSIYGEGSYYNDDLKPANTTRPTTVLDFSGATFTNAGCINLEYWGTVSNLDINCGAYTSTVKRANLSNTTPYAFWSDNTIRENVSGILCNGFSCKIDKVHVHGASLGGVTLNANACNVSNYTASNCYYGLFVDSGDDAFVDRVHANACVFGLFINASAGQFNNFRCDSIRNNGIYISSSGNIITNAYIDWCGDNALVIQDGLFNSVSFTSSRYAMNYSGNRNTSYKAGGAAIQINGTNCSYNVIDCMTWQGNAKDDGTSDLYAPLAVFEFGPTVANWAYNIITSSQLVNNYNADKLTSANIAMLLGCRGSSASNLKVNFATNTMIYYGSTSQSFNTPSQWQTWPA